EKRNLITMLDAGIRPDGRKLDEYRDITIETGVSETAEGSALVTIGDTMVIAGVKVELGTPYPDTPDEGVLMVGVELSQIASNDFESGPPRFDSIELARVTDRGIRESKSLDAKSLCLVKGEQVWMVNVDVTVMNDDGNLFDACGLAAIAAIKDAKFPKVVDGKADYNQKTKTSVPLKQVPLGVTVIKIGTHLLVDPTLKEMQFMESRLTVTSIEDGTICAMQKGGSAPFKVEDVTTMVDLGVSKAKDLRKLL
ncbi:MAG: exosome complex protein Rrp42, partial [Candidatus Woesearchaeota archaeon]